MSILEFHDKAHVPKRFFIIAVAVAAIAPRLPLDKPFSIGGKLSNSFRKLLLIIVTAYLIRHSLSDLISKNVSLFMTAVEGVMLSFLSLLTPYLLRIWLAQRVNMPGGRKPGRALEPWVYLFVGLSTSGLILRLITGDTRTWILKKVADILSFIPVMQTLKMYNSVVTSQVRYPGRGSVLSQIVAVGEFYALIGHGLDILFRALGLVGVVSPAWSRSPTMMGVYDNIAYSGYFRVLCHSILLNVLDEAYVIGSTSNDDNHVPASEDNNNNNNRNGASNVETVSDNEIEALVIRGIRSS